jgi:hypothetical protein
MLKTFANALVKDKSNIGIDPVVRQSLMTFYQRNMYIDRIKNNPVRSIIEDNEDACIESASRENFDYVILTWEGNIFDIHNYHEKCIDAVNNLDEKTNGNWLVCGQIIDQYENRLLYNDPNKDQWQNSFWLFPITAIVNVKKWRELGKPAWGGENQMQELVKVQASKDCIHDNYTPLEITAGQGTSLTKTKKSWNIVNTALANNLTVYNLPVEVRNAQNYLYPEVDVKRYNQFWLSLYNMPKLTDQYKKVLNSIITSKYPRRINDSTWQFFIRNTEDYEPRYPELGSVDWTKVEALMMPSSGFKDFIVSMGSNAARKDFEFIHFDIIPQCVDIKRQIIELWDGKQSSFDAVMTAIGKKYKSNPLDAFHMHSMKSFDEAYLHILPHFNGPEDLEQQWLKFKSCNHKYIEADMLTDPYAAIKLISSKTIYLCLSDIAGWRNNIMTYGYKNLRNDILSCITAIKNKNIDGFVDYKDPGTDLQMWQSFTAAIEHLNTDII